MALICVHVRVGKPDLTLSSAGISNGHRFHGNIAEEEDDDVDLEGGSGEKATTANAGSGEETSSSPPPMTTKAMTAAAAQQGRLIRKAKRAAAAANRGNSISEDGKFGGSGMMALNGSSRSMKNSRKSRSGLGRGLPKKGDLFLSVKPQNFCHLTFLFIHRRWCRRQRHLGQAWL